MWLGRVEGGEKPLSDVNGDAKTVRERVERDGSSGGLVVGIRDDARTGYELVSGRRGGWDGWRVGWTGMVAAVST